MSKYFRRTLHGGAQTNFYKVLEDGTIECFIHLKRCGSNHRLSDHNPREGFKFNPETDVVDVSGDQFNNAQFAHIEFWRGDLMKPPASALISQI